MDVRGIFDLFEAKKFDFEVELPPLALSLATFSLFEWGLHGSRKQPCGAIFLVFHMRVYHPVFVVSFFFLIVFAFMDEKKKKEKPGEKKL